MNYTSSALCAFIGVLWDCFAFKLLYRKNVVVVNLTTGMFLLFTCMHFGCGEFYEGAPTAYEVVRDCWKFEKHLFISSIIIIIIIGSTALRGVPDPVRCYR
jgi:hypothetical protein